MVPLTLQDNSDRLGRWKTDSSLLHYNTHLGPALEIKHPQRSRSPQDTLHKLVIQMVSSFQQDIESEERVPNSNCDQKGKFYIIFTLWNCNSHRHKVMVKCSQPHRKNHWDMNYIFLHLPRCSNRQDTELLQLSQ